jgi:hypothetical protein
MRVEKIFPAIGGLLLLVGLGSLGAAKPDPLKDRAAVERALKSLLPRSEEEVKRLFDEMGSDHFATRQKAQHELAGMNVSIEPLLKKLRAASEDAEVRQGLGRVLANLRPFDAAMGEQLASSVLQHGHRDLAPELLAVLPSFPDRRTGERLMAAARLSVSQNDRAEVVALLDSSSAVIREGAVRVLAALGGDEREAVKGQLDDESGMVRLAVAEVFAASGDAACLPVLGGLAGGEDFYLRWRAAGMLRTLTEGEVDIDPLEPVAEIDLTRLPNEIAEWSLTEKVDPIALFKEGDDLSGWDKAMKNLADRAPIEATDGYLRSSGTGHCAWGSPLRFQNYRARLEWRFPWADSAPNAGLALGKFDGLPPEKFGGWLGGLLEIELKRASSGAFYPRCRFGTKGDYPDCGQVRCRTTSGRTRTRCAIRL